MERLTRRDFLKWLGVAGGAVTVGGAGWVLGRRGRQPALVKPTETPAPTATARPIETVAPTATATLEATPTPTEMATEAPRPTATASPEAIARPEALPAWPGSVEEVAALFGGSADRWEINPDGGWHFREEGWKTLINPQGYLLEGYYDTKPGKNPLCLVSAGVAVEIQGGTIWPVAGTEETAKELQQKMAIPVWDDGKQHPCQLVLPEGE